VGSLLEIKKKLNFFYSLDDGPGGPKHVVKRGSEKCQNKHSVAIAGIDLCHIYIYICNSYLLPFLHLFGVFAVSLTTLSITCTV
jgi:hypothetical protein